MGTKRYYCYEFSNGKMKFLTPNEAIKYEQDNDTEITRDGYHNHSTSPKRSIRDGFQSGYNPALGKHIGGRREHERELNKMGLVEMGNTKPPAHVEKETKYFTKELGKELSEAGMSDNSIATMED